MAPRSTEIDRRINYLRRQRGLYQETNNYWTLCGSVGPAARVPGGGGDLGWQGPGGEAMAYRRVGFGL